MEPEDEVTCPVLPEVRIVLIGGRWTGKSSSANTILGKERFNCGPTRTTQAEVETTEREGRKLVVVDAPGWSCCPNLTNVPEAEKQRLKLNPSGCLPGPNAFLLVVPVDSTFSEEQKTSVREHMKLFGERVWRSTMVLFTYGDFLGEQSIEQHMESEGPALRWLMEKCGSRYHVFNNKDRADAQQVLRLLRKIDQMVCGSEPDHYKVDMQALEIIQKKQEEVSKRAEERQRQAEEQRQHMLRLIQEVKSPVPSLRLVLLGNRGAGKTSVGNTILGFKEPEDGRRTMHSVVRRGTVGSTEVTLVDTPGWWKTFSEAETSEAIKDEILRSAYLCPPGPHAFLLVIDADASFLGKHLDAVRSHVELLGEQVWRHTLVVFTRGDWLSPGTIEEFIEGEGRALCSVVQLCGNRYHLLNNKTADEDAQVAELLEKIRGTVAVNGWQHFVPDQEMFTDLERRRRSVEEGMKLRQSKAQAKKKLLQGGKKKLTELKIVLLGQKTSGKSAAGNAILRRGAFHPGQEERCSVEVGEVAGRLVTVIDTPGWWEESLHRSEETDLEIIRGVSLSESGVHAVLLVVPLDRRFGREESLAIREHMSLYDASVWKHSMVLFTHGDKLADRSVEEHIAEEGSDLSWLVDGCESRYHVMNNTKRSDLGQVTELLERIEEMVEANAGRLFRPDAGEIHLRLSERVSRMQLKQVLKRRLQGEYRRRELELMTGFRQTLVELQQQLTGAKESRKTKALSNLLGDPTKSRGGSAGQKKRSEKEQSLVAKLSREIEKLDKDINECGLHLRSSMELLFPNLGGETPPSSSGNFSKVLDWLSNLYIGIDADNQLTLKFSTSSSSSGYGSGLSHLTSLFTLSSTGKSSNAQLPLALATSSSSLGGIP